MWLKQLGEKPVPKIAQNDEQVTDETPQPFWPRNFNSANRLTVEEL